MIDLKHINESALPEKIRVYALAQELGLKSGELIKELKAVGVNKAAQSNLSRAEYTQLFAALRSGGNQGESSKDKTDDYTDEEKLRYRVEKNVENEIHQIEEKVDKELQESLPATEEDDLSTILADIDSEVNSGVDLEPIITPPPARVEFQVPQFLAPAVEVDAEVEDVSTADTEDDEDATLSKKRRRGKRGTGRGRKNASPESVEVDDDDVELADEPTALRGSTRLEAQRRRRVEMREESRKKRHIVSEAEFLARRESVKRTMVVRERERFDAVGMVTQVGVLEDELLVEHFVTSDAQASMIGNIYLGRVQNVLPSMEAAFIDIGRGRNGVLYAGEVDWRSAGLGGRQRKIEQALKSGDQVLVQVVKDPVGHKGARLSTQISLAGRYLVYVPGGRSAGISRKLPAPERKRLKHILRKVVPGDGGVIIRTAAEGVSEEAISADVKRLHQLWEQIEHTTQAEKDSKGAKPVTLYEEPNMLVKVVRDLFNEDFSTLVVDGAKAWNTVHAYIKSVAPDLLDRLEKFDRNAHDGNDAFEAFRINEQIHKALSRKVWLPSGGTLVIDRTEAMTVIDVNTGKFTGQGGNLEETVTKNNLEAAEEIVRQMRLRDLGGMIVVDFIDMVLPENQDLVLRRLTEALGRDRTRHQVSEVTSLGLVQMTRKRLGTGLLETFATDCEHCEGRGVIVHDDPIEHRESVHESRGSRSPKQQDPKQHPAVVAMDHHEETEDHAPTIEELAAAVVAVPMEDEKPAKTRRRRGVKKHAEPEIEEFEAIIESAIDIADAEDPDQPTGADYLPHTYEEAIADFEKSPRRKRKVRGNSTSDTPPQRSDFASELAAQAEERDPKEVVQEKSTPQPSRGRRRVKKTHLNPSAENSSVAAKTTQSAETAESHDATQAPDSHHDDAVVRRRKTKRRVVKTQRPQESLREESSSTREETNSSQDKSQAMVADESEVPTHTKRRGKRRVVRKKAEMSTPPSPGVKEEETVTKSAHTRGRRRAVRRGKR
ncbi:translation initiation factor IF-2 N-terminal domain-containing protein [Corynebacterium sp. ES2794-CONJ1]|uniref:translation initiation factor IF-2 N-terminal domain-containing protein n=1 Tax=Corynebacterium sp. ES2794-CONJ1 TaxID=2980553 RepID=UPI0021DB78E8|nr:translation initiation factor IF-2 N-terminal domain-containing protein [Corynebacterium sp. ES2794-CONJ1]MCU9519924.1 translation initiation factor IF-2 N-terminal domain-containing protein [Corynebacterium sp. ES2794-CONJ1]